MTDTIECYAAFESKGQLKPWSYTPRALQPYEVNIKVQCCGICGSDLHQIDNGWKGTKFPICPGHEIVGEVIEAGDAVKSLKVGDRVGVGAQRDSCGTCHFCKIGEENSCDKLVGTYNGAYSDGTRTYGGYAKYIRVNEKFAFKVPDNLPSEAVAPLLCAGATTFAPLKQHGVTKGTKLGVIGIGGLGHLGVKFGVALGAEVTAISGHESKAAEAKKLGAHHFVATSNEAAVKAAEKSLDVILCTANGNNMDFNLYFKLLTQNGKFIVVGAPEQPISFQVLPMLLKQITLATSHIGSPTAIQEMLRVASEHNIVADVQTFPIEQVNEAIQGVRDGKPHFRYVLKITQ